jgi:hypothetical protein
MSNQKIRKFRKNDWSDEEFVVDRRSRKDKREERRFERALRTKDFANITEVFQETVMYVGEGVEEEIVKLRQEGKI